MHWSLLLLLPVPVVLGGDLEVSGVVKCDGAASGQKFLVMMSRSHGWTTQYMRYFVENKKAWVSGAPTPKGLKSKGLSRKCVTLQERS